jgi:hypothetical protein
MFSLDKVGCHRHCGWHVGGKETFQLQKNLWPQEDSIAIQNSLMLRERPIRKIIC